MTRQHFEEPVRAGVNRAVNAAHEAGRRARRLSEQVGRSAPGIRSALAAAPTALPPMALGAAKVLRSQSRRHPLLAGAGLTVAAAGIILANPKVRAKLKQLVSKKAEVATPPAQRAAVSKPAPQIHNRDEADRDESLEATFPASDPVSPKQIT